MPYLGRTVVTNLADFHVDNYAAGGGFTAGSTTQLTLTVAGIDDEEALSIFFDGVHQHHNTYIIASSVVTFDTAIPTGTANVEIHYGKQPVASALAANVIDSEHYVDGSIDLAHMSSQSVDEDNLHISNSGSNGQFLSKQSGDAGGLTWATPAGGGWEFVSVVTASASATVAFTNMVSGYDYQYVFIDVLPATDGQTFHSQLGVSGPTYRTSSYQSVTAWISLAGTSATSGAVTGNAQIIGPSVGSATDEGIHRAAITLSDPANASFDTTWAIAPSGTCDDTSGDAMSISGGGGKYTTAEAHVAIKFYFASGNVASGRTYQYRRANA